MTINMGKKQTYKNIVMNIFAFGVQFVISFYISPLIVSEVGTSAYGFISLANDFVSYASILATVFNSVAARFIANSFYKKDYEKASNYFNSLIVANIIIAGILGIIGIVLVPNLQKILTISVSLILDVKLTFALIFISYIVSLVTLVFTTSTFVTNRTDIQGIRNIINYVVRFALIILFLNYISIKIYWIALATLIASIVIAIMNVNLTKRLTPELKINIANAKRDYALELAKSGFWMAFTSISVILMRGLDLTIANTMLGDYEMGLLSIARTMPNNVTSIIATIAPIFTPVFISFYAKRDLDGLIIDIKKSSRTMAVILFVPICGFIVFSYDFYRLWQKSLLINEVSIVTILSCITMIQAFFDSTTSTMAQLSVVTNKLKVPVLVSFGCGILNIIVVYILIKVTNLGVFSIVISSTLIMIIRYVIFNSVYAAYCLEQKRSYFILDVIKTWISIPPLIVIMVFVRNILPISSWFNLLIDAVICGILGYALMAVLYTRNVLFALLKRIIKRLGE